MTPYSYTANLHNHRFAAWAAGRAASTSRLRFSVETGRNLLEAAGLTAELASPDDLPDTALIDSENSRWRAAMKDSATAQDNQLLLTDGIAAKLINVYLKARFVCGGHASHPKVAALHPPIDKLLLNEMGLHDFAGTASLWRKASRAGWSNLNNQQYQDVIDGIRRGLDHKPMWMIEMYWRGHQ